jgi:regulator of protease activity HflC (stomatin/prohibitin superfamily)
LSYIFLLILCVLVFVAGAVLDRSLVQRRKDAIDERMGRQARAGLPWGKGIMALDVVFFLLVTLASTWVQVPAAHIGIQTRFGRVLPEALGEGGTFISPLTHVTTIDNAQRVIDIKSGGPGSAAAVAMTSDQVGLATLDVGFPYSLNIALAPKLYEKFRGRYEDTLLLPAAQFAVREASSQMTWVEATITRHEDFARALQNQFTLFVERNLTAVGFTPAEAQAAFVFPGAQLRGVLPPQRILAANAEYQAAQVDLRRQDTMTQIASKQAERRAQEGQGIDNLFQHLPKGYSSDDVYKIMMAVSAKENADALTRAIEEGKVSTMVVPYQSGLSMSAQAPSSSVPAAPVPVPVH